MTHAYSFDRAVGFYDRTRALPATVMTALVDALRAEVAAAGGGPVLEVGVGTGRIALPLAARGIVVHGVDVAAGMLAELRRKQAEQLGAPVFVCRAEASRLPVRDAGYGAAIASLVLHLLAEWQTALGEMLRALRPGGVLLIDPDARSATMIMLTAQLEHIVGRPLRAGLRDGTELDAHLRALGLESRPLGPFTVERRLTVRAWLDGLRANCFSQTWTLDDATRNAACDELTTWATARYDDLDKEVTDVQTLQWRAVRSS